MYQNVATKCLTGEARLSYAHLIEAYSNNGGEPKYSATILIPKTDAATEADIRAAINVAYENGVQNLWKGSRPQLRYPVIYDGDGVRPSGEPFGSECKGCWVITASSKQKPQVVHISNVRNELAPSDIYSGMYARVTVNFFPYDNSGNRGVGCGLGNVCKTRDGDPLSGRANAEGDFAALEQVQPAVVPSYAPATSPAIQYGVPTPTPQYPAPQYAAPAQPIYTPAAIDPITGLPLA